MKFSFVKHSKKFIILSAAIILIGILCAVFMGGFNLGIDFTGGSILTVDLKQTYDIEDLQIAYPTLGKRDLPFSDWISREKAHRPK